MNPLQPLAIWAPSGPELLVIMVIALLLFGRRLPEVARNLGKGVVEFKKGLKGVEEEIEQGGSSYEAPRSHKQSLPYSSENSRQEEEAQATPASGNEASSRS